MSLIRWHVIPMLAGAFVVPSRAPAQALPRLEPVPVAAALAELDFRVSNAPTLVVHSSGCLAMFNEDQSQMVCIDPTAGATRRFGRNGSGPGEFSSVGGMTAMPDGGLVVFDLIKNLRLTVLTRDWKLDRIVPLTQQFNGVFRATRDSVLAIGGPLRRDLVAVSLHDGGIARHFAPTIPDTSLFVGPNQYDFFGFWLVPLHRGGWYVVSPWHYDILVENDRGQLQSRFGRDLPRELLSKDELAAARKLMTRANPTQNVDAFMERFSKIPKAVIQRAPVEDGEDRLWVVTGRVRQDSTELDVFDRGGHFLGTRRVPGAVHAAAAHDADLYLLVEYGAGAHEGAQGVLHYRIR